MPYRRRGFRRFRRRRRVWRRRGYRRRTYGRGVTRAVRRALLRYAETKILPVLGVDFVMNATDVVYAFNPTYQIGQGTGSGSRVGRKISNAVLYLNLRATIIGENGVTANVADEVVVRMLVLRSRAVKTAGVASNSWVANPSGMTTGDIFYATGDLALMSQVNKNRWTVLKDVLLRSKRVNDNDNAGIAAYRRYTIPLGRNLTYRDDDLPNSFLTGSETYVVLLGGWRDCLPPDLVMHMSTQGTVRFKDC